MENQPKRGGSGVEVPLVYSPTLGYLPTMRCMEIDVLLLQYLVKLMMYTTEISETKLLGMRRQRGSTTLFH